MCGIAGIIWNQTRPDKDIQIKRMTDAIVHRGPDGEGHWHSENGRVSLGHRRLAIIDLSSGGHQPMHYMERFSISFNGELYNYIELRKELSNVGYSFKSNSDTEVLLAAYAKWGTNCLNKIDGMFAFAIYDQVNDNLFIARDRFGEKPLYYSVQNGDLYFASEMKALWAAGVPRRPFNKKVHAFLVHNMVEDPNAPEETFFQEIFQLKPAHYALINQDRKVVQSIYWELDTNSYKHLNFDEACEEFYSLLKTSVQRRLRADVPIGTSLSGGLDSSSIVSMAQNFLPKLHTFSARFPNYIRDEGKFIDIVSKAFKTLHHNIIVDGNLTENTLNNVLWHQEEPMLSGSIVAQWYVYKESRNKKVPVMLDGQGADELLGGYPKDFQSYSREKYWQSSAYRMHRDAVERRHGISPDVGFTSWAKGKFPKARKAGYRLKRQLDKSVPIGITTDFHMSMKNEPSLFLEHATLKETLKSELCVQGLGKLLRFADRNSMAHGVEVRLPFLSIDLVQFVFSLPSHIFFNDGWSKSLLRHAIREHLPDEITWRSDKIGFEAPHEEWTTSKSMRELYLSCQSGLIEKKIINEAYSNKWKTIVCYQFLEM